MRKTGASAQVRALVWERAAGRCEICGRFPGDFFSIHHRRARGMGGTRSKSVNMPANLLFVCGSGTTGCHGKIESFRHMAYQSGWLLKWGQDASAAPFVDSSGVWWLLDNDGRKARANTTAWGLGYGHDRVHDDDTAEAVDN